MRILAFALLVVAMGTGESLGAQELDPNVPARALRHLEQIIWPRYLFDPAGRPESYFEPYDGITPAFSDLRTALRRVPVQRLPGVAFSVASAYPSGCSHCLTRRAAVAQRDTAFIALAVPDDITDLVSWVEPRFAEDDSVAMKRFVVEALAATCLLGCELLSEVQGLADLEDLEVRFLRPVGDQSSWEFPTTYTHHSPGQLTMRFVLHRPAQALYRVDLRYQRGRPDIHVTRVAYLGL